MTAGEAEADPLAWVTANWDEDELGSAAGMLALVSVLRLRELLVGAVRKALAPLKLSATDFLLLMTLKLSDDRGRLLSRVANAMMVHPTTVTQTVDRLERAKLVKRMPHPSDRRATLATLTAKGEAACVQAMRSLGALGYGMPGLDTDGYDRLSEVIAPVRRAAGDRERGRRSAEVGTALRRE